MDEEFAVLLDTLDLIEHRIRIVGEIAVPKTVVEVVPHSKSGKRYARKRIPIDGKNTFEGCGQEGSAQHLAAVAAVQRRRLLDKAQDLIGQMEAWRQSEDWQALKPPALKTANVSENREPVIASPPPPPEESDLISFGFKGGKGATLDNGVK